MLIFKTSIIVLIPLLLIFVWIYRLRQSENTLIASDKKSQLILDTNPECIKVLNTDGHLLQINPTGLKMIEVDDVTQVIGSKVEKLVVKEYQQVFNEMNNRVLNGESCSMEYQIMGLKGTIRWVDSHSVPLFDENNNVSSILAVTRDITEKKETEKIIWKQANYDPLTQLPNRNMFLDRLKQKIKTTLRSNKILALIFLDLDHFKEVNDTLGHSKGDALLYQAAQRILTCVREADTVARMGGDEFVIILSDLDGAHNVDRVAHTIIHTLSQAFILDGEQAYVSASLGIALYPNDTEDADSLVRYADQAMYLSKQNGRGQFSFFTQSMQKKAHDRMQLLLDLREAVKTRQFELFYQPIVDLRNGHIIKAEALIRWHHPSRGIINSAAFIPLAEESGLIIEIGDWVFKEASIQAKLWHTLYHNNFKISINQSSAQFRASTNHDAWFNHLTDIGLSGENIIIEITESLLLNNTASTAQQLLQFQQAGIQLSIDDFGTNYSALSYLQKFGIDYLKIDHSLTQNLALGSSDLVLSEAIILMAHKLGIKVIAEGIETQAQQDLLIAAGCEYGQGYLFSKPVPAIDFEALLIANNNSQLS